MTSAAVTPPLSETFWAVIERLVPLTLITTTAPAGAFTVIDDVAAASWLVEMEKTSVPVPAEDKTRAVLPVAVSVGVRPARVEEADDSAVPAVVKLMGSEEAGSWLKVPVFPAVVMVPT